MNNSTPDAKEPTVRVHIDRLQVVKNVAYKSGVQEVSASVRDELQKRRRLLPIDAVTPGDTPSPEGTNPPETDPAS